MWDPLQEGREARRDIVGGAAATAAAAAAAMGLLRGGSGGVKGRGVDRDVRRRWGRLVAAQRCRRRGTGAAVPRPGLA